MQFRRHILECDHAEERPNSEEKIVKGLWRVIAESVDSDGCIHEDYHKTNEDSVDDGDDRPRDGIDDVAELCGTRAKGGK